MIAACNAVYYLTQDCNLALLLAASLLPLMRAVAALLAIVS
jgi:hypothetical protein